MTPNFLKNLDLIAKKTLILEIIRSALMGVIETAGNTFFLLYIVRVLSSDNLSKSLVMIGGSTGLLLSPFITQISAGLALPVARLASIMYLIGGIFTILVLIFDNNITIAIFMSLALATWNTTVPLTTQIYTDNYPVNDRGKLFSLSLSFRVFSAAITAYIFGILLESSLGNYDLIFICYAICFFLNSLIFLMIPSNGVTLIRSNSLKVGFGALKTNRVFKILIISWMFLGFGNLMLIPLRVEFLANPIYGNSLSTSQIAFLVSVIPNIFRLLFMLVWGSLFDKADFFKLRIFINIGFMLGSLSFFFYSSWALLLIGSIFYGISLSGGDIAWNLWVTKFAPLGKSKAYMAVHTFFTGIRGILAPIVTLSMLQYFNFDQIVLVSVALMLIATMLLFKETNS